MTARLLRFFLLPFFAIALSNAFAQEQAQSIAPPPDPFDFADVTERAKALAREPYAEDTAALPDYLSQLDYDQYRDIRYRREKSLWYEEGVPFQLQFFHRGFLYRNRVTIHVVDNGVPQTVAYQPEMFDFGKNRFPGNPPPEMGFAGLRILHPLRKNNLFDEIGVFVGASYFRVVGLGHAWGISARGLALDTGMAKAEEFPVFREFWVEKPGKDSRSLTVYALLDSPSITGTYRFVIHPGLEIVMDVQSRLFLRQPVERFGIAPLTSMFFHGENTDRFMDDFRPEVHDSDGLLIHTHGGEWIWRPLNNPRRLQVSVFQGDDVAGFGLMQRDRDFEHYQDLESMFHLRPSAWVEPVGNWGGGSVYLIEIPSEAEKYDNIVAFWVPAKPTAAGQEWAFDYRLHFLLNNSPQSAGGRTLSTRVGASGTDVLVSGQRKFVVDFEGDALKTLSTEAPVEAEVGASSGQIKNKVVQKNILTGAWRLVFELSPDPNQDPVDLRAYLKIGNDVLTETWIHQWNAQ